MIVYQILGLQQKENRGEEGMADKLDGRKKETGFVGSARSVSLWQRDPKHHVQRVCQPGTDSLQQHGQ